AALMICGRAEVHGRDVDHVAIKILQVAVVGAAAVPAQLGVPVKIAAHDMQRLAIDACGVGADGGEIAALIGVARLDGGLGSRFGPPGERAGSWGIGNTAGEDLLPVRTMEIRSYTIVCGPCGPQAGGSCDCADMRAGTALAVRQRERVRPTVAAEM